MNMAAARLALNPQGRQAGSFSTSVSRRLLPAVVAVDLASTWSMAVMGENSRGLLPHGWIEKMLKEKRSPAKAEEAGRSEEGVSSGVAGRVTSPTAGFSGDCGVGHIPGPSLPNSASARLSQEADGGRLRALPAWC